VLTLPIYPGMTVEQVDYVCATLKGVLHAAS
jgi:dTDP-4-amino-4,6-dideoxygalactose transaminase